MVVRERPVLIGLVEELARPRKDLAIRIVVDDVEALEQSGSDACILRAERDVTIKKIRVKPGDSVAVDAVIMEFA